MQRMNGSELVWAPQNASLRNKIATSVSRKRSFQDKSIGEIPGCRASAWQGYWNLAAATGSRRARYARRVL
jgi:hypothetical protein